VSLSGLLAQNRSPQTYRDIAEEFRSSPDAAIAHLLDLPDDAIAQGIGEAVRHDSIWPLESRGAALLMHTDAALLLQAHKQSAALIRIHLDRALDLADALARDPESAWFVHQWFIVVTAMLKDESRANELINRWHSPAWYAATASMDHGLMLESNGSLSGSTESTRWPDAKAYEPDAFRQAVSLYRQAIEAHLEIAAVHLGRIEMLRGHDDEARRLFEQAADGSHWRTTRYLANLFLGSMDERVGDPGNAERRYRAAVATIDKAQSGHLALAAFLSHRGGSAEAARVLADDVGDTSWLLTFDPWWSYLSPYKDRREGSRMILGELHVAVGR
jgi:tetratricopeptide (TPR) repeat protein